MSCINCTMEIHTSGRMAWWQGVDYVEGNRTASIQAGDAACEHFELFVEEFDRWNDETHVTNIPIRYCPWCGQELRKKYD